MVAGNLSIQYGMKGPNIALVSACTTGTHNIGVAGRTIAYGDADVMVAGASEMEPTKLGISGFASTRALSMRVMMRPNRQASLGQRPRWFCTRRRSGHVSTRRIRTCQSAWCKNICGIRRASVMSAELQTTLHHQILKVKVGLQRWIRP